MISTKQSRTVVKTLLSTALIMGTFGTQVFADSHVTLVEMGDLHGTLVSHAAVLKRPDGSEYQVKCHVTASDSRQDDRTIIIAVKER